MGKKKSGKRQWAKINTQDVRGTAARALAGGWTAAQPPCTRHDRHAETAAAACVGRVAGG